ncbi:MAG: hypothetical protein Q7K65_05230 [Candidatus Buchananbacteria bacterium]|nr:hypothetical protein [Candidatus Buchananbacteria bacterium]
MKDTIFDLEDVSELTAEILETCLDYSGVLGASQDPAEIAQIYFENNDHGFSHSQDVWQRCQEVVSQSPLLWQMANLQVAKAQRVLILTSIFHNMGRFLGVDFTDHEEVGAELARRVLAGSILDKHVFYAIFNHDYICPLVNGYRMPKLAMFPLSEIFRLADKTSVSPQDEVRRYYRTGKRVAPNMSLFDSNISDETRFDLSPGITKGDMLTWFLVIFALQSTDFIYGDTRDAYAYWARGKHQAMEAVGDLCLEEEYLEGQTPADPEEAKAVVKRFCQENDLIISA